MSDIGLVIGIVAELDDPVNLGRVRVTYPHLDNQLSPWASLVTPFAGKNQGMVFRPDIGDEVLVGFLHGAIDHPYIMGSLWNQNQPPPQQDGHSEENNERFIKSRSGHIIMLDDTQDQEKIEIVDKSKKHKIIIDCSEKNIQIICEEGDIEFKAPKGKISLNAMDIEMKSKDQTSIEAQQLKIESESAEVESKSSLSLKGESKISLDATTIEMKSRKQTSIKAQQLKIESEIAKIESKSSLSLKGGTLTDLRSSGLLNLKGTIINLN